MFRVLPAVGAVLAVALAATPVKAQRVRIGVFDSRMVALAYYNSDAHRKFMQQLMSDLQAAKAANDTKRVAELEFQGPALQSLMHYQVFSNASIPNILATLTDVLPKVAAEAKVSAIVSKWDVAYRGSEVEYVDVTDALVRPFNPSDKVRQWIADGKTKEPMPLLEAVRTLRPER